MQSRRDVLRLGAGVASAGAVSALAGCSNVPVVGSYFEDVDYTAWAYDPDSLDMDSVTAMQMDIETILETDEVEDKGDLRDDITETYSGELVANDVEYALNVGRSQLLVGSFDGDEVVDGLGLSSDGSHGDFEFYEDEDDENALIATDGDYLVRSSPMGSFDEFEAREELELLIDTYDGDSDGFVDENDDFADITDEIDSADYVTVSGLSESAADDADDDEVVANGTSASIDGTDTNGSIIWLFKDEDGIDLDEIESDFEEDDELEIDDLSQDGRTVTAEFTLPTEEFL